MSKRRPDWRTWAAGVVFFVLPVFLGTALPNLEARPETKSEPKSLLKS
jgi:hypothetical protein